MTRPVDLGPSVRVILPCLSCGTRIAVGSPRFVVSGDVRSPSARPPFACPSCGAYHELVRGRAVPRRVVTGRRPILAAFVASSRPAVVVALRAKSAR